MKRSLSDSEDDLYDDGKDGSPSQSGHSSDRKKRRGVIEKRRRDRINHSLAELRRLVPTAFEKQGSAKLEKAEILQMTVDHLKMLHQKGINGYNFDPNSLAMDYRSFGFRECAAEVSRYLVTIEGMDLQDPLRLRLLSHLQCYASQRDFATKSSLQMPASWNSVSGQAALNAPVSQYGSSGVNSMGGMFSSQNGQNDHLSTSSVHSSHTGASSICYSESRLGQSDNMSTSLPPHMRLSSSGIGAAQMPQMNGNTSELLQSLPQLSSQFPMSLNMNTIPMLSPNGTHAYNSNLKPYRPWGAELAY